MTKRPLLWAFLLVAFLIGAAGARGSWPTAAGSLRRGDGHSDRNRGGDYRKGKGAEYEPLSVDVNLSNTFCMYFVQLRIAKVNVN